MGRLPRWRVAQVLHGRNWPSVFSTGELPMEYLTNWRLRLGAEMLHLSEKSVAEIVNAVGYSSEARIRKATRKIPHRTAQQRGCLFSENRREDNALV